MSGLVDVDLTVGLPVYNGARTLRETLDALLAQTYPSFEVLVSDNASTDSTPQILAEYVERDERVKVLRQPENRGAIANLQIVLERARTPLFTWFGADDLCAPTYLERARAVLLANPGAIIAAADVCTIDERGNPRRVSEQLHTVGLSVGQRVNRHLATYGWYASYGVARRDLLLRFGPFETRFGTDVIRTTQWILAADVVRVPEPLFLFRERTGGKDAATYAALLAPGSKPAHLPHSEMLAGIGAAVRSAGLDELVEREALESAARTVTFENPALLGEVIREQGDAAATLDHLGRLRMIRGLLGRSGAAA